MEKVEHIPVLLHEAVNGLNLFPGAVVLDGTLGGGGYAREIAKAIGRDGTLIGLDLDAGALERARMQIGDTCKTHLVKANFRNLKFVLETLKIEKIDAAVFDLGVSSYEIGPSGRGFSFMVDEPLLMTFDDSPDEQTITAKIVVNDWSEKTLETIIRGFGGERHARKIASVIVSARTKKRIETSGELARVIQSALPRLGKLHPATKTFQAIRMAVNDELGALKDAIEYSFETLNEERRLAIVSFHEGEDRIVKHSFRNFALNSGAVIVTKKPVIPTDGELKNNPRARSAKLRILEKMK